MTLDRQKKHHCIFCGKGETDFEKGNMFTVEHIVPFALGNRILKTNDVCKKCNSGLGMYVDNYVLESLPIKMIRQEYKLTGQSGKIPNPFSKGRDENGHIILMDDSFTPKIQEFKEENENKIRIVAPTKDKAKNMLEKTLKRKGFSQSKIDEALAKVDAVKPNKFQPEIQYDFEININRFLLEALKIAYEYAVVLLGEKYESDSKGVEIRDILLKGINGHYKEQCPNISGIAQMDPTLFQMIATIPFPCHSLLIHPDTQGYLIAEISLFKAEIFSYAVLLSKNAYNYDLHDDGFMIIPIQSIE